MYSASSRFSCCALTPRSYIIPRPTPCPHAPIHTAPKSPFHYDSQGCPNALGALSPHSPLQGWNGLSVFCPIQPYLFTLTPLVSSQTRMAPRNCAMRLYSICCHAGVVEGEAAVSVSMIWCGSSLSGDMVVINDESVLLVSLIRIAFSLIPILYFWVYAS